MVGAVYDRGYRAYEGERGGRASARSALFRASVRRALGLRRPWRQKITASVLLGIAVVPAIVNVGVSYLTRDTIAEKVEFFTYRDYVGVSNTLLVFVALTAPDIMCPDRRQRVLPLVFARPLTGVDYVVAKVGAMFSILFAFSFLPQVVLFLGQMLVSNDGALTYARDNAEILWQVPVAVVILALWYAVIGVAVASLTSRRIIAGASIIALFLVTFTVAEAINGPREEVRREGQIGPPVTNEEGEVIVLPPGGFGDDDLVIVTRDSSPGPLLDFLRLPLVLRDVVFLGEVEDTHPMSGLQNGGWYAGLVYLTVVAVAFGILFVRYREVER
jgi:ABC-2 type transport system permease protein